MPLVLQHEGRSHRGDAERAGEHPAWRALAAREALAALGTDAARGLTPDEAGARRREYGPNQLAAQRS